MRKTNLKKLAAVVLSAAMVLSMGGMTAFAEETGGENNSGENTGTVETDQLVDNDLIKEFTITKTINKEPNVFTPAVEVSFTIENGSAASNGLDRDGSTNKKVYGGLTNGITFTKNAVFSVETDGTLTTSVSAPAQFQINKEIFKDEDGKLNPGIYRYTFRENETSYDGLVESTGRYIIDLYVGEEDGKEYFSPIIYKDNIAANNKVTEVENTYETNNLTLTKKVEGNQGDKTKGFEFEIVIKGADGEKYYITDLNGNLLKGANDNDIVLISNTPQTVTLKDTEGVLICGLSENDTYTIKETNYKTDGYTTEIKGADTKIIAEDENTEHIATGKVNKTEENSDGEYVERIIYTNTKSVTTPTGIALTFAPYALLVALAGVFGFFFLRKKREDEV